jgi:hypothetical protein
MANLKLICNNPSCINKSIVYRRITSDGTTDYECKKCGELLSRVPNQKFVKQDIKAKNELREFNSGLS